MNQLANHDVFQKRIDNFLAQKLDKLPINDDKLHQAMRYGLLIGGKRIRPYLAYITGEALGASLTDLDGIAGALECIHAYSLLNDD